MAETPDFLKDFLAKPDAPGIGVFRPATNGTTAYGRAALEGEVASVLAAPMHTRNTRLNKAAFKLGQNVAGGELSEIEAVNALTEVATLIGLDASEIAPTVRSGIGAGQDFPRNPKPLPINVIEVDEGEFTAAPEATSDESQTEVDRRYLQLSAALLDVEGIRNIKPATPLVDDYLFTNSLAWLSGKPGNGKSFVAIELACCVATGTPWHSHGARKGKVLYVIAEGVHGFAPRVDAWIRETGIYLEDIRFLPIPVHLMRPLDVAAFAQVLDDFKPALIIFDTQARVTVGAEENSSKDMGQFVDALEQLRGRSGACILAVHHEPRTGENLRGSTALEGAATTILRASKEGDQVTVSSQKQKDVVSAEPLVLTLEARDSSAVLVRAGAEARALSDSARKLLAVLAEFGDKWVSKTTLHDAAGFLAKTTFYRALNELVNRGLVWEREDAKNRYSYRLPEALES